MEKGINPDGNTAEGGTSNRPVSYHAADYTCMMSKSIMTDIALAAYMSYHKM